MSICDFAGHIVTLFYPRTTSLCRYNFMDRGFMLFIFENKVPLMRLGASVGWRHLLLPLVNSFFKNS